ncbi:hypothetical protein [Vibrio marisflavi]|uniref:Uncharacterized protein n=1 Tax=Vibrio marisflavi CECT 7928 TaxID=634439 RepID=A0ABM9AA95_9VIBR|nr:hypothetical protein [Vibrio marisflavi]CAH0543031.1 hypothetical protein VMF7928_04368 [Vibrio marisflavi CECT 7928]
MDSILVPTWVLAVLVAAILVCVSSILKYRSFIKRDFEIITGSDASDGYLLGIRDFLVPFDEILLQDGEFYFLDRNGEVRGSHKDSFGQGMHEYISKRVKELNIPIITD